MTTCGWKGGSEIAEMQKVDVLSVMAALSLQTRQRGGCPSAPTIDDASDAVAKLMVAAADFLHVESCAYNAMSIVAPRERLRAALAAARGEG